MLNRSNVAAASVMCVLGWALMFGVSADAIDHSGSGSTIFVLFGRAGVIAQDQATGGFSLSIDDGARDWSCAMGAGVQPPEAGSQVIAICSLQPGTPPTILRIIHPWFQNVF